MGCWKHGWMKFKSVVILLPFHLFAASSVLQVLTEASSTREETPPVFARQNVVHDEELSRTNDCRTPTLVDGSHSPRRAAVATDGSRPANNPTVCPAAPLVDIK